jgi:hypothetical protein
MAPLTMSDADAEKVTRAPFGPVASVTTSPGTVRLGGVVSRTVTVNVLAALVLPESSVAVQLTVVTAIGNMLPDGGAQDTLGVGSTRSEADAEYVTVAPPGPVASVVMGPGTLTVGGVVSWTVTVNEALAEFPESSVAVQVTVVGPIGNRLPEGGAQTTVGLASTRSDADAENVTTAPPGAVAGAVMFPGTVTVGGAVSCTVTEKAFEPVLP